MQTIAIVGGGFAGTAMAIHLSRASKRPLRLIVIDPAETPGPGRAHSSPHPDHRLNGQPVMHSLYPESPLHFEHWLAASGTLAKDPRAIAEQGAIYARRQDFGRYLAQEFRRHQEGNPSASVLEHRRASVIALEPDPIRLQCLDGPLIQSDAVVLALGWGQVRAPAGLEAVSDHPAFIDDPWSLTRLRGIAPDQTVVLLGSGLTALDTMVTLAEQRHRGPIVTVSRRGRQPPTQPVLKSPLSSVWDLMNAWPVPWIERYGRPAGARQALHTFRAELERVRGQGLSDQAAFDGLRDAVRHFWPDWAPVEKRRFMRHLKAHYDLVRYRAPPQTRAIVDRLVSEGQLQAWAGRVEGATAGATGSIDLEIRLRGGQDVHRLRADALINCTGPQPRPSRSGNPLWLSLIARGWARDHPSGLGVDVDGQARLLDAEGRPVPRLYAVGPATIGQFGEISAAPHIARQVRELAMRLTSV